MYGIFSQLPVPFFHLFRLTQTISQSILHSHDYNLYIFYSHVSTAVDGNISICCRTDPTNFRRRKLAVTTSEKALILSTSGLPMLALAVFLFIAPNAKANGCPFGGCYSGGQCFSHGWCASCPSTGGQQCMNSTWQGCPSC